MRHFYDPLHPQQVPRWGRNSTQSWMFSNLDQIKQITLSCGGAEKMWFRGTTIFPARIKCLFLPSLRHPCRKLTSCLHSIIGLVGGLGQRRRELSQPYQSDNSVMYDKDGTINGLASKSAALCCTTWNVQGYTRSWSCYFRNASLKTNSSPLISPGIFVCLWL